MDGCFFQMLAWKMLFASSRLVSNLHAFVPPAVSSIFTVPNVKLQTESGDSIQVCARKNSHGKASSGSKHWPAAASCTWLPDGYVLISIEVFYWTTWVFWNRHVSIKQISFRLTNYAQLCSLWERSYCHFVSCLLLVLTLLFMAFYL